MFRLRNRPTAAILPQSISCERNTITRPATNRHVELRALSRWLLVLLLLARGATAADDGIMIKPAWIEMADSVRLSADLYMPSDLAGNDRLPVLLEYLPYRKNGVPGAKFMTTTLRLGGANGSFVELPVVPPGNRESPEFLPPEPNPKYPGYESVDVGTSSGYGEISSLERNPQTGEVTATATNSGATSVGYGDVSRNHRSQDVGRTPGKHVDDRHAPYRGAA